MRMVSVVLEIGFTNWKLRNSGTGVWQTTAFRVAFTIAQITLGVKPSPQNLPALMDRRLTLLGRARGRRDAAKD